MKKNKLRDKIRKEVSKRHINKNFKLEELIDSCIDEYNLNIENGLNEKDSFNIAVSSLNDIEDSTDADMQNRYKYALTVSGVSVIISLTLAVIGLLSGNVLSVYGVLYPICFIFSITLLVFTIITHKKRKPIDFLICIIIILGCVFINVESLSFFYRIRTGDFYYTLYYKVPGVLNFYTHGLIPGDSVQFEIIKTDYLFDPTLLINFICFIICTILHFVERRKKC